MPRLDSIHQAPELLTGALIQGDSKIEMGLANRLADAYRSVALALGEPMEPGAEELAPATRELALKVAEKVMDFCVRAGSYPTPAHDVHRNRVLKELPTRCDAARRALRAMGVGSEEADRIWEAAFNDKLCEREGPWDPDGFAEVALAMNTKARLSESLCWSGGEHYATQAITRVCEEGPRVHRLTTGARIFLDALEALLTVSQTGSSPERARSWMNEREAKAAKAMMSVIAITAEASADPSVEGKEFLEEARGFIERAAPLSRMIEASEQAAIHRKQDGPANVKQRRIGPH